MELLLARTSTIKLDVKLNYLSSLTILFLQLLELTRAPITTKTGRPGEAHNWFLYECQHLNEKSPLYHLFHSNKLPFIAIEVKSINPGRLWNITLPKSDNQQ